MPRAEILQVEVVSELHPEAAPARSVRRATARRASSRRATARGRQGDPEAAVIAFLVQHPGSTTGDVAKGLNLDSGRVSLRLTQLAKAGEIKKTSHGYNMEPGAPTRRTRAPTPSPALGNEDMLFDVGRRPRCGCYGAASSHRASRMFGGVWGEFLRGR